MRRYIVITGAAAVLLALAHLARIFLEGSHLLRQPAFLLATVASVSTGAWAFGLLWKPG